MLIHFEPAKDDGIEVFSSIAAGLVNVACGISLGFSF